MEVGWAEVVLARAAMAMTARRVTPAANCILRREDSLFLCMQPTSGCIQVHPAAAGIL
jgi:hypothetical protein